MRKFIAMLLTVALLVTGYGACFADRLKLPAAVQTIEKEAFYGDTSVKEVVVPYGTQYIMARAFAYSGIEKIYIPDTVTFIASNAFDGADDVVICAPEGSYAAAFAEEYDYICEASGDEYREQILDNLLDLLLSSESEQNIDPISTEPYSPHYISTEGITDQKVLEMIVKYNKCEDEIVEQRTQLIEDLNVVGEAFVELSQEVSDIEYSVSNVSTSIRSSFLNYDVICNYPESRTRNFEVTSVMCPDNSDELRIEFTSNGSHYYLYANPDGMSVSSSAINNAIKKNAEYDSSTFHSKVQKLKEYLEQFKATVTTVSNGLTVSLPRQEEIVSGIEKQIEQALKVQETGLLNYAGNPLVTDSDLDALKNKLKNVKTELSKLEGISKFLACFDFIGHISSIITDIRLYFEIKAIIEHGHPTETESSNPYLSSISQELKEKAKEAQRLLRTRILVNSLEAAENVATLVTKAGSFFPQIRATGWVAQAAIDLTIFWIKEYVCGKVLDSLTEQTYKKVKELDKQLHGIATGKITDEDTGDPIKNVSVKCGAYSCYSNSSGWYVLPLPTGTHKLTFEKKGYKTEEKSVVVNALQSSLPCNVSMTTKGAITGTVVDATTGEPISGVTVQFGDYITTTNSSGRYIFEVKAMSAPLSFSKEGYIPGGGTATVEAGKTKEYPFALSKKMALGTYRVVLSWGLSPKDLDSHLTKAGGFHVYFSNKSAQNATLDHDDTTSYGPETITFIPDAEGTYTYYVHDYTNRDTPGSKALSRSGAVVRVYCGDEQVGIYRVPSYVGLNWTVFTITNGVYKAAG